MGPQLQRHQDNRQSLRGQSAIGLGSRCPLDNPMGGQSTPINCDLDDGFPECGLRRCCHRGVDILRKEYRKDIRRDRAPDLRMFREQPEVLFSVIRSEDFPAFGKRTPADHLSSRNRQLDIDVALVSLCFSPVTAEPLTDIQHNEQPLSIDLVTPGRHGGQRGSTQEFKGGFKAGVEGVIAGAVR